MSSLSIAARIAIALVAAFALLSFGIASAQAVTYPNSMDALGDSITRAFNTCSVSLLDCPENSWSTGTNAAVDSIYQRILATNLGIGGHEFNDAVSGTKMTNLNSQATNAVSHHVELVTILMGSNDACTSSISTMTATSTYESQFKTAINTLTSLLPSGAQIAVGSLPNAYRLWELFHTVLAATTTWKLGLICQSLLENPTSTALADVERRAKFKTREEEYDKVLAGVCTHTTNCKWDNEAGFKSLFTTKDITTRDYFHPSIEGQALIASTGWTAFGY